MKKILSFFFLLSAVPAARSQDVSAYARSIVDTLAGPYYHGRGYLRNGEKQASYFIASELYKMGLKRFAPTPTFYQNFNLDVNTFPSEPVVALGENFLSPGRDFIPAANCPGIRGSFRLEWLDSAVLASSSNFRKFGGQDFRGAFIVIDKKGITSEEGKKVLQNMQLNPYGAKGFIYIEDKLTWSVATDTAKFASLHILRNKMPRDAKELRVSIRNAFVEDYQSSNVMAYVEGKEVPDTFLVFSAHFDHLGKLGRKVMFPGASDNASGIAMMLSLAKHYSKKENQPKYSIAFIAFGGEEAGLLGSRKFVLNPVIPLERIRFLLNMDIMGANADGVTIVNATEFKPEFELLDSVNQAGNYLPKISKRGKAANSDHYYFSEAGVHCFFMYSSGGVKAYHDIDDRPQTLPMTKFEDAFQLIVKFADRL